MTSSIDWITVSNTYAGWKPQQDIAPPDVAPPYDSPSYDQYYRSMNEESYVSPQPSAPPTPPRQSQTQPEISVVPLGSQRQPENQRQFNEYIRTTKEIVMGILGKEAVASSSSQRERFNPNQRPFILNYFHQPKSAWASFWDSRAPSTTYVNQNFYSAPVKKTKEDTKTEQKEKNDRFIKNVAIVGAVVLAIGSFFAARSLAGITNANSVLEESDEIKKTNNYDEINTLSTLRDKIMSRTKTSCTWDLALRTMAVVGSLFAVAAVLTAKPILTTVGIGLMITSVACMIFKAGYEYSVNTDKKDAEKLNAQIQLIEEALVP